MAGEQLTLPSGTRVVAYTEAEVETIGDTIDRAEASMRATTGPCHGELATLVSVLQQLWDTLQANTVYTQRVARLNATFPADLVGGAWLTTADAADLLSTLRDFANTQRECELTDDPSPWVVDPADPRDPTPEDEPKDPEPPAVAGVSGGGGGVALGLALAGSVVFTVWLLFRGKR